LSSLNIGHYFVIIVYDSTTKIQNFALFFILFLVYFFTFFLTPNSRYITLSAEFHSGIFHPNNQSQLPEYIKIRD
jgi:hypothetical protein